LRDAVATLEAQCANLEIALQSARMIGVAIGILMAMRKVSYEDAFQVLIQASQESHRKLRDIAADVERLGTLPVARRRFRAGAGRTG